MLTCACTQNSLTELIFVGGKFRFCLRKLAPISRYSKATVNDIQISAPEQDAGGWLPIIIMSLFPSIIVLTSRGIDTPFTRKHQNVDNDGCTGETPWNNRPFQRLAVYRNGHGDRLRMNTDKGTEGQPIINGS